MNLLPRFRKCYEFRGAAATSSAETRPTATSYDAKMTECVTRHHKTYINLTSISIGQRKSEHKNKHRNRGILISRNCENFRSGGSEPTRRRFRERAATARLRPPPHCRARHDGSPAVRHLETAARLPRLRLQDPDQILRDRVGQAWLNRWHQTKGTCLVNFYTFCCVRLSFP